MYSTLPSDASGEPTWGYGMTDGCTAYTKRYLKTGAMVDAGYNVIAYTYARVINCTACKTGYEKIAMHRSVDSTYAQCELDWYMCQPDGDYVPVATCTTDAQCETQLGSNLLVSYVPDYTTGEDAVGQVLYNAKCGTNKHCQWVMSVANSTASWVSVDASLGKWTINSATKCVNGHYGGAVLVSQAQKLYVQYCIECPDIDAEYIGGTPDYLQGSGASVGGCYLKPGAQFRNAAGYFETIGTCVY